MNVPAIRRNNLIVHTAAWLYAAPRVAKAILVFAVGGLAALMIFGSFALNVLHHLTVNPQAR